MLCFGVTTAVVYCYLASLNKNVNQRKPTKSKENLIRLLHFFSDNKLSVAEKSPYVFKKKSIGICDITLRM
jgi:hypothetical protein